LKTDTFLVPKKQITTLVAIIWQSSHIRLSLSKYECKWKTTAHNRERD